MRVALCHTLSMNYPIMPDPVRQHFAVPAHDDKGLCRTCRKPIEKVGKTTLAWKHLRVLTRTKENDS